jgi:hypothetical protein
MKTCLSHWIQCETCSVDARCSMQCSQSLVCLTGNTQTHSCSSCFAQTHRALMGIDFQAQEQVVLVGDSVFPSLSFSIPLSHSRCLSVCLLSFPYSVPCQHPAQFCQWNKPLHVHTLSLKKKKNEMKTRKNILSCFSMWVWKKACKCSFWGDFEQQQKKAVSCVWALGWGKGWEMCF